MGEASLSKPMETGKNPWHQVIHVKASAQVNFCIQDPSLVSNKKYKTFWFKCIGQPSSASRNQAIFHVYHKEVLVLFFLPVQSLFPFLALYLLNQKEHQSTVVVAILSYSIFLRNVDGQIDRYIIHTYDTKANMFYKFKQRA